MSTVFQPYGARKFPSIPRQAVNATMAAGRALSALAQGQPVLAIQEKADSRIAKCNVCEHLRALDRRCTLLKCGCFVDMKVKLETERCPDEPPRWT